MAIELPDLPYAPSALAPHLSATTLELHHDGHHRAHVEEVNRLLPGSGLEGLGLEDIVRRARGRLAEQAALAWSHGFYWTCLSPRGGGEPSGAASGRNHREPRCRNRSARTGSAPPRLRGTHRAVHFAPHL